MRLKCAIRITVLCDNPKDNKLYEICFMKCIVFPTHPFRFLSWAELW